MLLTASNRSYYILRLYLLLGMLEGWLALFFLLRLPSSASGGVFGYSAFRLGLAGLGLLGVVGFAALTYRSLVHPAAFGRFLDALHTYFQAPRRWLVWSLVLGSGILLGWLAIALWNSPALSEYSSYSLLFKGNLARYEAIRAAVTRLSPLLVWGFAVLVQSLLGLLALLGLPSVHYRQDRALLVKALFALLAAALALFHWAVLALGAELFTDSPGWYWSVLVRGFSGRDLLYPLLAGFALLIAWWLLRGSARLALALMALVLLGYSLQVGFGFLQEGGFEAIRLKYAGSYHKSYAVAVSEQRYDPVQVVRDYEQLFGETMFPGTKPPGVILTYLFAQHISQALNPQPDLAGRFLALTRMLAVLFPLLASLAPLGLYLLGRRFLDRQSALLPGLLYLVAPNFVLLPLFLDQALYPLLFVLGALLAFLAIERASFPLALLAGAYAYLAAFLSFSLLAVFPLMVSMLALDFLARRKWRPSGGTIRVAIGLFAGLAALFLLFRFGLGYDPLLRYRHAMDTHVHFDFEQRVQGEQGSLQDGLQVGQVLTAAWRNNLEFAAAVGFPLYLLFLAGGLRLGWNFLKGAAGRAEVIQGGFLLTFLAINLFGQTQGEVARLWLFWLPAVALVAALQMLHWFGRRPFPWLVLLAAQLLTIYLTFKFQDFIV